MIINWFKKVDHSFREFSNIDRTFIEYCNFKGDYGVSALKYSGIYGFVIISELIKLPYNILFPQKPKSIKITAPKTDLDEQAFQTETYEAVERCTIHSNAYRIAVQSPNEPVQKARWQDIESIALSIDDLDPTELYTEVVIKTQDTSFNYPEGAIGSQNFMNQLFKIKGFKRSAYNNAINCTEPNIFTIYSRP